VRWHGHVATDAKDEWVLRAELTVTPCVRGWRCDRIARKALISDGAQRLLQLHPLGVFLRSPSRSRQLTALSPYQAPVTIKAMTTRAATQAMVAGNAYHSDPFILRSQGLLLIAL
jgi:hypothetical protein